MANASSWSCVTKIAIDLQLVQLEPQPLARLLSSCRIEIGERLIEKQHGRVDDDRASERDALLLATREGLHGARSRVDQSDAFECLTSALEPFALARRRVPRDRTQRSRATVMCGKSA